MSHNYSDDEHNEALELSRKLVADLKDWSERDRLHYFIEHFAPCVMPAALELGERREDAKRQGDVTAGAMMLAALAGFLKGALEAEGAVGMRDGLTADERDILHEVYTNTAEVTYECSRVAGIDFAVFQRHGKSKLTDPDEIAKALRRKLDEEGDEGDQLPS
ncbi:MAG: hypothetical protein V2I24_09255 [Halieaceae bacterium]|jgi:hypothetical protein|nr:hypothetical protein [Halieaceae bacterium]